MAGLQDYTRLQKLGVGSFASAHLMQHKVTGKKSVLKRIACQHLKAANAALLEVKVLLACNHINITAYHDFFLDSDSDENIVICLLMEFCSGGDLWERIAAAQRQHTVLPMAQSTGWLLQIIAALRYLHSCGILHRDVKPENIFITEQDSVVKLGDFGLAKGNAKGQEGNATTQCGTPDYMAPEVLEGRPYEAAADIFSLGAVLYALLTSRFPKMLALHVSQGKPLEWPDQRAGGQQARQLAARMLQLDPAKRGDLDSLAARAATLPGSEALQGQSLLAREAAKQPATAPAPPSPPVGSSAAEAEMEAASAALAAAASAGAPLLPSRPEAPLVSEVTAGLLSLRWKAAPEAEGVLGYRVLLQAGGSEGFREVIADTGRAEPTVRLDGLSPGTWYEVKVCALSAAGTSPPSPPCSPVQTQDEAVPVPGPTTPRRSASEALLDDSGLHGRYAQVRCELQQWDNDFERAHGRGPTEREKAADPSHQELLALYKRLKQAKRRSTGSSSSSLVPEEKSRSRGESPELAARCPAACSGGGTSGGSASGGAAAAGAATAGAGTGRAASAAEGGEDEGEIAFSEEDVEVASQLFKSYDLKHTGKLKLAEFTSLMQALSSSSGRPVSSSTVEDLFRRADKEGKGAIDFNSFLQIQRKRRRMKGLFRASATLLAELSRGGDSSPKNGGSSPDRRTSDRCTSSGGGPMPPASADHVSSPERGAPSKRQGHLGHRRSGSCGGAAPSDLAEAPRASSPESDAASKRRAAERRPSLGGEAPRACAGSAPPVRPSCVSPRPPPSISSLSISPRQSTGAAAEEVPRGRDKAPPKSKQAGSRSNLLAGGAAASSGSPAIRRPPSASSSGNSLSPTKPTSSRLDLAAAPVNGNPAVPSSSPTVRRKSKPDSSGGSIGGVESAADAQTVTSAESPTRTLTRVMNAEVPVAPPAIDRARRQLPDGIEAKTPAVATEQPAAASAPKSISPPKRWGMGGKKASPAAKPLPPGSEIRVAVNASAAASGFRVAVKSSHPSPRPFAANDLTFE